MNVTSPLTFRPDIPLKTAVGLVIGGEAEGGVDGDVAGSEAREGVVANG